MRNKLATTNDLRSLLAKACADAGGQCRWAEKNGVSAAYVNDAIYGRRDIGPKISSALGYKRVIMYEHATAASAPS